jgi:eukaryotic-like serine/threonine-protein kinase
VTLAAGSQLGPYEILSPLGAGGMGEVYRARDTRLGRDVAIKVLPQSFSQDAGRLRRFEQEARAASALNHPNIVTLHDVGEHGGAPYVVTELLEGETLRSRLAAGAITPRKATEYAIQIAQGLAAAHEKGIVHRDLKPENLFVTEDGRIKILDFGLAKLIQPDVASQQTSAPTASLGTEPGVVMGTVGYMSPEQVKGQPADHRSDVFSFGAVLYEMLSGRRAFHGDSTVETMSAILKEEPPDLSETNKNLSPGLDRLVRHCLEKSPTQRFQSARDLAYDLESLSGLSGAVGLKADAPRVPRRGRLLTAGLVALAGLAGWNLHGRLHRPVSPTYQQVTYRRGVIYGARFAPDADTIVYAASWNGQPLRVFSTRIGSTESRDLGLPVADVLAVSRSGELALCLGRNSIFGSCTLARVPLAGGAPREVSSNVYQADWAPDGRDLAIIRRFPDRHVIEYPVGKVLYESSRGLYSVRFSPQGNLLAFAEQDADYESEICVLDLSGKKRVLTKSFFARSLAWRPSGDEIWFDNADRNGLTTSLYAVTLAGRSRAIRAEAMPLDLSDIASDGRALVVSATLSSSMSAVIAGEPTERNVSWLDYSTIDDVSRDGRTILFDEWGEGGGRNSAHYLWRVNEPAAVRLGDGVGHALSPDGKWALISPPAQNELILQPTGTGQSRSLGKSNIEIAAAAFLPDGSEVVSIGRESGHGWRLYRQPVDGGQPPKASSGEGLTGERLAISPDGRFVAVQGKDDQMCVYPLSEESPRCFDSAPAETPLQWSADGRFLFVCPINDLPGRIDRLDVVSGKRELWKSFGPSDLAGVQRFDRVAMAAGGASYVYSTERVFCTLFVIGGLR